MQITGGKSKKFEKIRIFDSLDQNCSHLINISSIIMEIIPKPSQDWWLYKSEKNICTRWPLTFKMAADVSANSVNNAEITPWGGQKGAIWTMIQIYFGFFVNVGWKGNNVPFFEKNNLFVTTKPSWALWVICHKFSYSKNQFLDFRPPGGVLKIKNSKFCFNGRMATQVGQVHLQISQLYIVKWQNERGSSKVIKNTYFCLYADVSYAVKNVVFRAPLGRLLVTCWKPHLLLPAGYIIAQIYFPPLSR